MGSAMKIFTATAMMIALLTVPAYSQSKEAVEEQKKEQKKRAEEAERDYNAVLKRTTPQTTNVPTDPWQNVRPSTPSKPKQ